MVAVGFSLIHFVFYLSRVVWKISLSASIWTLWRKKNAGCLDSKAFCMEDLTEKVKFSEKPMVQFLSMNWSWKLYALTYGKPSMLIFVALMVEGDFVCVIRSAMGFCNRSSWML